MITVQSNFKCRAIRLSRAEVEQWTTFVCSHERRNNAAMTLVFTDDRGIRPINKKHLGHDRTTDVISFTLEDSPLEGELYINLEQARRQASEYGVSPKNEAARLVVHGVLHCCGYDDTDDASRARMFDRQERHVTALGVK
ncbi:MAG TPA: rRNA maturation RNase YbeY [Bacteroidota bacterium]|nr:rRNA maturation RNase YbeY [Bacteroidota bacterium]